MICYMGKGHALKISRVGIVKIRCLMVQFQWVSHVKGLKNNLLSIEKLDNLGSKTHTKCGVRLL